ncbi:MAG TPA: nucleoside 2-deoxyribosyltransferase domain-containing protein [Verrucomicrobiae bacterium]|nr:nucleoside 2-deoxyribosyltransferase domain-containing protein [Verrucomicrobiae bacterium]
MTQVITAPEPLPTKDGRPLIFLAGSIDEGTAENWQTRFIAAFKHDELVWLNPRRENWQASVEQRAHVPEFRSQVEWELAGLECADIIVMYFAPGSRAPISLLETGLFARSGKLMVACPDGFWRKGNVEMVCAQYNIPLVNDLEALIQAVRVRLTKPKTGSQTQKLCSGKFLALIKEGHWEYVERVNSPGAAIIVAVTAEQKLLLVEQYRIPLHCRVIELPAGMIGDDPGSSGESHAGAARRELLEETGYDAGKMEPLFTSPSSAGLTSERVTLFMASQLRQVGKGGGVEHEEITVHEVPLTEINDWLEAKAKAGFLVDAKVYAGLYFVGQKK